MNNLKLIAILAVLILFTGCHVQHYYAPVMYNNNASYMAKPLSTDEKKSQNYVSGGVGFAPGINLFENNDNIYNFEFDAHRANTFKFINVAYGVFGYAGGYQNGSIKASDANYFDTKAFAGFGAKLSVSSFTQINPRVDFRALGIDVSYSNELGTFSDFRNSARNNPNIHTDNNNQLVSAGLTSEVAWRGHNPSMSYAVRGYLGTIIGNHGFSGSDYNSVWTDRLNIGGSFYMKIKNKYFFAVDKQQFISTTARFGLCF